jgi:hypothetical protein
MMGLMVLGAATAAQRKATLKIHPPSWRTSKMFTLQQREAAIWHDQVNLTRQILVTRGAAAGGTHQAGVVVEVDQGKARWTRFLKKSRSFSLLAH